MVAHAVLSLCVHPLVLVGAMDQFMKDLEGLVAGDAIAKRPAANEEEDKAPSAEEVEEEEG